MFTIFRSLRSLAILALSTGQFTLYPNGNVALAAPPLETRYVGPFSGQGHLVVRQGSTTNGCIDANGHWTTGGPCAVFSAAPQGEVATQLTTSAGQCGLDTDFELVCEFGNPNGPENWHNNGYLITFGHVNSGYLYTASTPTGTDSAILKVSSAAQRVQLYWQQL